MRYSTFLALLGINAFGFFAIATEPATPEAQRIEAQQVANQALAAEADGDFIARQRLLRESELLDNDCLLAKSQKGEVQSEMGWLSVEECVAQLEKNAVIAEYEQWRGTEELNAEQHFSLAQWCLQRQLTPQAYGHLNRVLQLDSDHEPARRALGFQRLGTEWISPSQLQAARMMAETTRASIEKFGKPLKQISRSLTSPRQEIRDEAIARLNDIKEPDAVPAVSSVLSSPLPNVATVVIKWLAQIDSVESSQALSRYAMFHPDDNVRRAAGESLKGRPLHDFVPNLIGLTVSPVAEMLVPVFGADGTLSGYRQAFAQEGAEQRNLFVVDTSITRVTVPAVLNAPSEDTGGLVPVRSAEVNAANRRVERSVNRTASQEATSRQAAVQQTNAAIAARNVRIAELLSQITNDELPADPQQIWRWWDKHNEFDTQSAKEEKRRRSQISRLVPRYEGYAYAPKRSGLGLSGSPNESPGFSFSFGSFFGAAGMPRGGECFVAGTPVMTHKGLRAIERVRTGDLVLSRDLESGTLAWKPVITATQRPPELTKEIQTSSQKMRCTGGHLFWVSGKGWEKASNLKPGDVLHCASEPTVVSKVDTMPAAPTFNLFVADNANYFVGSELVLSHDVTKRESTRLRVPGLHPTETP